MRPPPKSTARLLWAVFSLFVVYGTTFPFSFHWERGYWKWALSRVNWLLLGGSPGDPNFSDLTQNILLFIPFGFLGYYSLVFKSSPLKRLGIVAAGAALSAFVEFLQVFSGTRYPALSDVICNTAGTAAGLGLALMLKKSVVGFKSHPGARRFLDSESSFPAFIFLVLTVMGCWLPFDFTLEIGTVWSHLKPLLDDPLRLSNPDDDMMNFIRFLLTTLFLCRMAQEAGLRRPALWGTALMAFAAVGLEGSQIFIQSRGPETQDAAVAVLGALAGGLAFFSPGFHLRPFIWSMAGGLAIFLSAATRALAPYHFTDRYSGFNWAFFQPQFAGSTFAAIGDFAESAMLFFPLGFLLAYFLPRIRPTAFSALLAGGMALIVETFQGFIPGRYSDVTDVLGAVMGALAGSLALTRGWPAFREYMADNNDREM
jgi:glycopeptide antibiotics resistance protein